MVSIGTQMIRDKLSRVIKEHSGSLKVEEKLGTVINPFLSDVSQIFLETRAFNESPLNCRKCCNILTKVLFLIDSSGESLTPEQKSELFFGITRLFQASDQRLRRMVYLLIKTIKASESEVFIVTSSLMKDMNRGNDSYRGNAIRVFCRIIDPSMATQIERYLKTAIVDRNPFVASSALVCALNLFRSFPDIVKRWVNEVQQCVNSKYSMVQFHALALLHELKGGDRLALQKIVGSLIKSPLKSSLAECLLIRYTSEVLMTERDATAQKILLDYLEGCLRHKSETAVFEAAKAFCDIAIADSDGHGGTTVYGSRDIVPVVTVLQIFLSSPRPVLRFAAVRTLSRLAQVRPHLVSRANADLEPLLSDANRNISTLALTTLLKTGHESSVERLIKQVKGFINEIPDSFKADIVSAVKQLCLSYPNKHKILMTFLASNLREEGSFEYKRDIVDSLIHLSHKISQAQESGLLHLCEFIEDCEYPALCTQILSFLASHAPLTANPSKYIRFIYNRLILESALIRASGVDALAKIAMNCPPLRGDVLTLLECCLADSDDEVRDRANMYYRRLAASLGYKTNTKTGYIIQLEQTAERSLLDEDDDDVSSEASTAEPYPTIEDLLQCKPPYSIDALCEALQDLAENDFATNLDLSAIPSEDEYQKKKEILAAENAPRTTPAKGRTDTQTTVISGKTLKESMMTAGREINAKVCNIVSSDVLGQLIHTCRVQHLTEKEAEYNVEVVKHVFQDYFVLEFHITNTMQDQILENVKVVLQPADDPTLSLWEVIGCTPLDSCLHFSTTGSTYVVLRKITSDKGKQADFDVLIGTFQATLTFLVKEVNDDIGYEDEYSIEPIRITVADYVLPRQLAPGEFKALWDVVEGRGHKEVITKLSLPFKTLKLAVESLPSSMGLAACDKTDEISDTTKSNHALLMSGTFVERWQVLAKSMIVMSTEHGCLMKLIIRCRSETIASALVNIFDQ